MESSEDLEEACSSSESGWTMYIASPKNEPKTYDDDSNDGDDDDDNSSNQLDGEVGYRGKGKDDEGSDDSMASDASSGPSHQLILRDFKNAKGGAGHHQRKSSGKNPHKQVEKNKCNQKKKTERDEHFFARKGGKARKPH